MRFRRCRERNHVERLFNRLKQSRRIATQYDKTAKSLLAFLNLASAKIWLNHYVKVLGNISGLSIAYSFK